MKNSELIKRLSELPDEMEVCFLDHEYGTETIIKNVSIIKDPSMEGSLQYDEIIELCW